MTAVRLKLLVVQSCPEVGSRLVMTGRRLARAQRLWFLVPIIVCGLIVAGCSNSDSRSPVDSSSATRTNNTNSAGTPNSNTATTERTQSLPIVVLSGKIELRVGEGEKLYSFKSKGKDTAKFYDKDGRELCKFTFSPNRLKVKSPDDQPMFELKRKGDKVMVKDASGENELFKFKLKGRDIDFYAPGDNRLYRLRHKDYGYALEDNSDTTLFRAKQKDDRIVLRDRGDKTVLYSNELREPLGLLFFRISELSVEQQAACLLFFLEN